MNIGKGVRKKCWTTAEAKKHIEAQASSGLTTAAYERDNGIGDGRLWWWRQKLAQAKPQPEASAFVPVQVNSAKQSRDEVGTGYIEVRVGPRRVLRVRPGFDTTTLQKLVAALEQVPC